MIVMRSMANLTLGQLWVLFAYTFQQGQGIMLVSNTVTCIIKANFDTVIQYAICLCIFFS